MFNSIQIQYLAQGAKLANQLSLRVKQALGITKGAVETKRHAYIFSPPGAGKTFTVNQLAKQHNVPLIKIQGAPSMSYFITAVAMAVYFHKDKDIIVWLDDSDSIFMNEDSLNVMKGALDQERNNLVWSKNLSKQISSYLKSADPSDNLRGSALKHFSNEGDVGVTIPTNHVRFIITSNKKLTAPTATLNTPKKMHEAAIRDRVKYIEFDVDAKQTWGWMGSVLMNNEVMDLTDAQKFEILDFMWQNWNHLPSNSMRAVCEYAEAMLNDPENYRDSWELSLNSGLDLS